MAEEQNVNDPNLEQEAEDDEEEEDTETDTTDDDASDGDDAEGEGKDDPYSKLSHEDAIERLKKADRALVKHKKHGKDPKQPKPITKQPHGDEIPEWGKQIIQTEEKRTFGYEHTLSPEQVDAVFRYNGGQKPDEKVLERPEVKAMVKALQSRDRVAANTPRGGSGVVFKGQTFAEVASNTDASRADKQSAFEGVKKRHGVA